MGQTSTKNEDDTEQTKQPILNKNQQQFVDIYQKHFKDQKTFSSVDMLKVFPNRKTFSDKFYDWICFLSYRLTMNRESFFYGCEILLSPSDKILNYNYKNHQYNIFELLIHLVVCKKPDYIKILTEDQVIDLVKVIFDIWFGNDKNQELMDSVLEGLFDKFENRGHFDYTELVQNLRKIFPTGEHFIKRQLQSIFLDQKNIHTPEIDQDHLLTHQILVLIGMTNNKLLNQPKCQLLFGLQHSGNSFYALTNSLKGYSSPIIMLIEIEYQKLEQKVRDVIGVYADCLWEDKIQHFGNSSTYLFSIKNKFDVFFPILTERNFIFLNTQHVVNDSIKTGIGFGGDQNKSRIWLDQDLLNKSQIHDFDDKTFREGILSGCYTEYLNITNLEVWGFPNNKTEKIQDQYKEMQHVIQRASTNFQNEKDLKDVKQSILQNNKRTTYF